MSTQKTRTGAAKQVFDASSPGFLYTVIVSALTIFAASGVIVPGRPRRNCGRDHNAAQHGRLLCYCWRGGCLHRLPDLERMEKRRIDIWRTFQQHIDMDCTWEHPFRGACSFGLVAARRHSGANRVRHRAKRLDSVIFAACNHDCTRRCAIY
jgi:hypothetical protein